MASRYWVGATDLWDGTAGTKWALTSGGAGGQAVPTSADNVFFSSLSTGTCTVSAGNTGANSINCTGFTGTLAGTANISVAGNVTLVAGMSHLYTGIYIITTTATFTSGGKTVTSISFNVVGSTLSLGSALTLLSSFILSKGTLNLNGFTLTTGAFMSSSSNTRAVTFGSANIVLVSSTAGQTILSMADADNFTWTGSGGFVRNMVVTSTVEFGSTNGTTPNAPNMTVNAGASALTITANSWFNNLIFTGSTSTVTSTNVNIAGDLTLASGGTYTTLAPTYRDTGTLTNSGKTLSGLTVNGSGIIVTCADALTTTNALTLTLGTLKLKNAVTSTVGSVVTTGTTTTLKYLESSLAGTQATISDATGTNTVTYLSIKDSNATGGAVFDATDPTNVNVSNSTGWIFGGGGGNFLTFF